MRVGSLFKNTVNAAHNLNLALGGDVNRVAIIKPISVNLLGFLQELLSR